MIPQATKNNIIIQPFLHNSKGDSGYETKGGIYVPIQVEEKMADKNRAPHAIVISIGPNVGEVKVGQEIIYNKFAAKELSDEFSQYMRVSIEEVYGVID